MKRASMFVLAVLLAPVTAVAWSPKTDQAVVSTAIRLLSKGRVIQLSKLDREVMQGASVTDETLERLFPGFEAGPITVIQSEMHLLDAVRGDAIDPYLAYRLGVLGRLVARISAPLARDNSPIRARYYADVEKALPQTSLKPSPSKKIELAAYIEQLQRTADARKELIVKDYQSGPGFDGVARAALSDDLSRSIDAVANVWYTLLTERVVQAGVSDTQRRNYAVQAMAFYVARGNENEIELHYNRLTQSPPKTPEMVKQIGDILYNGGFAERAIKEYEYVLALEPQRKDVVERISGFYIAQGDKALESNRLEEALDAYSQASKADPLHPTAEAKRLEVSRMIADRDARLEAARTAIDEGGRFEAEAEQFILKGQIPEAFDALKKAQAAYNRVTDEFRTEAQAAAAGVGNINARLRELKNELIGNAQALSGSAFRFDIEKMAAAAARNTGESALRKIVANQLAAEMAKLKNDYQNLIAGNKKQP